jgi:prolyl 4-hydroxylase
MIHLSSSPDVWMMDDFVDEEGCHSLAALARDTSRAASLGFEANPDGSGFCLEVPIDGAPVLELLRARIEDVFGLQSDVFESVRYRRYATGEGHPPHVDCYSVDGRELIATALLYLRDTPAGGETEFTETDIAVAPRRGRLLCWYNHLPDGSQDPMSRHEGRPVIDGDKEVLMYFIYKPAECAAWRPLGAAKAS